MNFKFHHVAIAVRDMQGSVKWYRDKLGFEQIHEYRSHDLCIVHLQLEGVRLELISFGDGTKELPRYRTGLIHDLHTAGTKHLCIEVNSMEETILTLKQNGVEFISEIDTTAFGGRYIFFKDCNGILIELYQK